MAYGILKCDNITFDNGGSDQNVTVSGLYRATTSGVTVSGTIVAATVSGVTIIGGTTVSGATVTGTTANFTSGNFSNIISSAATMSGALIMANQQQVRFREAVGNGVNHIALQAPAIVSADQTITLPDQTGTVVTTGDNGSVTSTMILDGTILNADINASAAIAGTKISPDFGSQTIVTTGVHSAAAGSAAAPSIAFTGDPNTGIYSPGADQLAVSTGGTGRLFVASDGKVGIGTSVPTFGLMVVAPAGAQAIFLAGQTGVSNGYEINSTGSALTHIWSTAGGERVRITDAGNVGIGTASPSQKLHVSGGDTTNVGFNGTTKGVRFDFDGTQASIFGVDNTFFASYQPLRIGGSITQFMYGGTEAARIDSSGRVGIGTSSPTAGYLLDCRGNVKFGSSSTAGVYLGVDSNIPFVQGFDSGATYNQLKFLVGGTEAVRINSSGNVGIGTSSPTSKLTVLDGAVTAGVANGLIGDVLIGNYSSNFGPYFKLSTNNTDSSNGGLSIFTSTSGSLTEKLRIDSSGNVGIGTSSPLSGLHLANGTAGSAADFTISNPANLWSIRTGTTDNALLFVDTQFSAERLRIDSSGNVGIGTTSPTTLLDVNADTVRVRTARTPASASATGATGEICWDANYIYVCTATNTWKRSAISTW